MEKIKHKTSFNSKKKQVYFFKREVKYLMVEMIESQINIDYRHLGIFIPN